MIRALLILFFACSIPSEILSAQDIVSYNLFLQFNKFYTTGDFVKAEETMLKVLNSKNTVSNDYIVAACNNLGATCTLLGKYIDALTYYNQAEIIQKNSHLKSRSLADIYVNKAIIYGIQKSYQPAIEYFEKALRIYLVTEVPDKNELYRISTAYLNLGIIWYELKNYQNAIKYLEESLKLKIKFELKEKGFVYLNLAKTYFKLTNVKNAENFFLKSLTEFNEEYGPTYYRTNSILFDYGLFLRSVGRVSESLNAHRKALSISLLNYGEKHTFVSLAYKHIGDHYTYQKNYDSALYYYQKSLVSVVKDFNNSDIYSNPPIDSVIFDIRLLDDLKSKALALDLLSKQQTNSEMKLKLEHKSFETIELAIQLIERIRNNYVSEESRIYLAENEKETYMFATQLAYNLYNLRKADSTGRKMYDLARRSKSAVLRNGIAGNELILTSGIPDSIRNKKDNISGNIAAYNNLIAVEFRKKDPDIKKISFWKDALFEMDHEKENISKFIDDKYPQFKLLLQKTRQISLSEIQKQLGKDETVIEYLLSNQYSDGKRRMYIFTITKTRLNFIETALDSLFLKNVSVISQHNLNNQVYGRSADTFGTYTEALYYMYDNLVKPVERFFAGTRLVVIPDEEIARLPLMPFFYVNL